MNPRWFWAFCLVVALTLTPSASAHPVTLALNLAAVVLVVVNFVLEKETS